MRHLAGPADAPVGRFRLQVTRRDDKLVMASFGHVCVALWNCKPTLSLFEEQRSALAACARRHPRQTLFLCVVSVNSDPPDAPVREASSKMVRDHAQDLLGCACVIEGSGFRAAVVRSVLTGMNLLVRAQVPSAFFQDTSGAVEWLSSRAEHSLVGLAEQLDALRRQPS